MAFDDELHREVDAFAHNERNLLIVVGPPGTSKSTTIRKSVVNARFIEGGSTPYRLYLELYEHKDLPIILDLIAKWMKYDEQIDAEFNASQEDNEYTTNN